MKTKEIIKRAQTKVLELTDEVLTSDALYSFLNLAYLDIQYKALSNKALKEEQIHLVENMAELPEYFLAFHSAPLDQDGNRLVETELNFVRTASSQEKVFARLGNSLRFPKKTNIRSIDLAYYQSFPALDVNKDPQIDARLHECLIYGVVYRSLEDLQDPELANYYETKYKTNLMEAMSDISAVEGNAKEGVLFSSYIDFTQ